MSNMFYLLGIMDTLNDWNEKLNSFASGHMDSAVVGTIAVIGTFALAAWGISALNKK